MDPVLLWIVGVFVISVFYFAWQRYAQPNDLPGYWPAEQFGREHTCCSCCPCVRHKTENNQS